MPIGGVGNITNAPLYVDTNNWVDLRLRPDSPCIDAANNDFVTWDTGLDGNPRIINGVVDMGAYEFVPLPPPTLEELVQGLIDMVNASDLKHQQPLLATLNAALASIKRGNCHSAVDQLGAFQNKVRAQVAPDDPALAAAWITAAQEIIELVSGSDLKLEVKAQGHGAKLKFRGLPGKAYTVEVSSDLQTWTEKGGAVDKGGGNFELEDGTSSASRFYRVIGPQRKELEL